MANNQFGPGTTFSAAVDNAEVKARQQEAMREDDGRQRAALAAGPDRRSVGAVRQARADDADEM